VHSRKLFLTFLGYNLIGEKLIAPLVLSKVPKYDLSALLQYKGCREFILQDYNTKVGGNALINQLTDLFHWLDFDFYPLIDPDRLTTDLKRLFESPWSSLFFILAANHPPWKVVIQYLGLPLTAPIQHVNQRDEVFWFGGALASITIKSQFSSSTQPLW